MTAPPAAGRSRNSSAVISADAVVARYGGEEFACLLFQLGIAETRTIAERIREAVAERHVQIPGRAVRRVTISAGIACRMLDTQADAEALLRDADDALYAAKRAGRNRVSETPQR